MNGYLAFLIDLKIRGEVSDKESQTTTHQTWQGMEILNG